MSYLCETARFLPLILCLLTLVSIFLTYAISVGKDHVSSLWPYISDTGTKPPESCIFGLLLSSIAFLMCIIIYIRYREVSEFAKLYPSVNIRPLWNRVTACLGFLSALGLHLVANFQELNEFTTHIVGALICFFSATLYFILQTIFTRKMQPEAKFMFWIRIIFTLLNILFIVGTFAPVGAAMKDFKGHDILKWTEKDGGFGYHITSTFSEWLLVCSFCAYISTMFWDFRKIKIEPLQIKWPGLKKNVNPNEDLVAESKESSDRCSPRDTIKYSSETMNESNSEIFPPVVELNVGGVFYTTSLSTLRKQPESRLAEMFSGKNPPPKDSKGKYFLDRDGVLFRYVLDFLRNESLVLPESFREKGRLVQEATYFGLPEMTEAIEGSSVNKERQTGFITVGYRGSFAFGRDGLADVKFRKLSRILVCGRVTLCRDVFGETLNESRDPDHGVTDRYTSRFFLKHSFIEQAFDMLQEQGFKMCGSCGSGTAGGPTADLKPGVDLEENRWNHYNEFVFVRD